MVISMADYKSSSGNKNNQENKSKSYQPRRNTWEVEITFQEYAKIFIKITNKTTKSDFRLTKNSGAQFFLQKLLRFLMSYFLILSNHNLKKKTLCKIRLPFGEIDPQSITFWVFLESSEEYVKKLRSIHTIKMEQFDFNDALKNRKVIARSLGVSDIFDIIFGDLQGYTLALFPLIIYLDYLRRTSIDIMKENRFIQHFQFSRNDQEISFLFSFIFYLWSTGITILSS